MPINENENSILDRYKDKGFFKEQLYDKVNIMDENSLRGQQIQRGIINDIANSIDGITNGFTEILSKFKNPSIEITVKEVGTTTNRNAIKKFGIEIPIQSIIFLKTIQNSDFVLSVKLADSS